MASVAAAQTSTPGPPVDPNDLWFQNIESGGDSPLRKIWIFVFKTPEEFQKYLGQINDEGLKKPVVDWKQQQMVAIQARGMSQDGSSIRVKRIHRIGNDRVQIDVVVVKSVLAGNQGGPGRPLNLVGKEIYPYAIIQTQRFSEKPEVRVITE